MLHPEFDLDVWRSRLSRAIDDPTVPPAFRISGRLFTDSPVSIVVAEQFRAMAAARGAHLGPSVPVDRFVFGKGEAPSRHLTKVNGLPYRPKGRPWPRDRHGAVMTFLTQLCFADSRDALGELPGDVLCVFARTESGKFVVRPGSDEVIFDRTEWGNFMIDPSYDPACLAFEWYPLGLEDLPGAADLPEPRTVFPTCYALRYRSYDYVDGLDAVDKLRAIVPLELLEDHDFESESTLRALACYPGMKIGGVPFSYGQPRPETDARFLGSFSGVNLACGCPYPWANVPEPLGFTEYLRSENFLDIRDGFHVNLFIAADGSVEWTVEFP
jgi:hypothetical protein